MSYSPVTNGPVPGGVNGNTSAGLNTTGASLLIFITDQYVGGSAITVSDSNLNTWNPLTSQTSGELLLQIWYAKNPTVGTGHTFTISGSVVFAAGAILAFSGADTTAPFDAQNGATIASGTTLQTGSVTPGQANELIIAGIGTGPGTTISSIDSSFTITDTTNYSGGVNEGVSGAYLIETTLAAKNPTWTITNPNAQGCAAVIATFKAAAGGTSFSFPTAAWHWNGQAPAVAFANAAAQKSWVWHAQPPTQSFAVAAAQKAWLWNAQAFSFTFPILLAQKAWAWTGNAASFGFGLSLAQRAWGWLANPPSISGLVNRVIRPGMKILGQMMRRS